MPPYALEERARYGDKLNHMRTRKAAMPHRKKKQSTGKVKKAKHQKGAKRVKTDKRGEKGDKRRWW
jgi:hypothetical protein